MVNGRRPSQLISVFYGRRRSATRRLVNAALIDKACRVLGAIGILASVAIHTAAWLGGPVILYRTFVLSAGRFPGFVSFDGTFLLFFGVFPVFGWAVLRAQERFGKGRALWQATAARWPSWVERVRQSLTYYALGYWVYVLYLRFAKGVGPSDVVWARFYSAFALIFYFAGLAILWATVSAGRPASEGGSLDDPKKRAVEQ